LLFSSIIRTSNNPNWDYYSTSSDKNQVLQENLQIAQNAIGTYLQYFWSLFFELSVPCGTISAASVREAMLRIVKRLRA